MLWFEPPAYQANTLPTELSCLDIFEENVFLGQVCPTFFTHWPKSYQKSIKKLLLSKNVIPQQCQNPFLCLILNVSTFFLIEIDPEKCTAHLIETLLASSLNFPCFKGDPTIFNKVVLPQLRSSLRKLMSRKGPRGGQGILDFVEDCSLVLNRIKSPSLSNPFLMCFVPKKVQRWELN